MPIRINPEKKYTIPYVDNEDPSISFSMTFKFPYGEDVPCAEGEYPLTYVIRVAKDSIIATEGIIDENTGEEITLTPDTRKYLHDFIRTLPNYIMAIAAAYIGPKGKNLSTGVMGSSTTDGQPSNVDHASLNTPPNVEPKDATLSKTE